ncbi:hypothetical protein CISIN_1g016624mg [Citrus sinensis]|uniref:RING-type E3 ubiquitin transferase n=1 Tax=Citrus sinensis TaxID=2711 RepID=A0A067FTQ2_CITSI|nr:hypothetical protein CISIN_1g016624mg [Citrus sinensis]
MEVLGMEEGKKPEDHMTSAAAFVEGGIQDSCDDACSICLEEFSESDPSTVTSCKHEFHLQCVLEWCQRSSQCPMCWQPISLKDATSQELLEAVEQERSIRANPPRNATIFHHPTFGDFELQHLPVGASDTDLEEHILQHLTAAAAMGRAHHFGRRESHRNRSAAHGRPHFFVFSAHPGGAPPGAVAQGGGTEPAPLAGASPSVPLSSSGNDSSQHMLQFHPIQTNQNSSSASGSAVAQATRRGFSFNNRYKESISKSTRGWKERLFSRNASMPGTGSENRSENVGITSVSRLMEQLGTGESTRGSEASVSSHMANPLVTEQNSENNTETRGENPVNNETPPSCAASSFSR